MKSTSDIFWLNCRSLLLEKKCLEDVDIRVICTQILQLFMSVQGVLKEERVPLPRSLSWLCPMTVTKSYIIVGFSSFWLNKAHNISCCKTQTSLTLLRILLGTLLRVRYTLTGNYTTDRCHMLLLFLLISHYFFLIHISLIRLQWSLILSWFFPKTDISTH